MMRRWKGALGFQEPASRRSFVAARLTQDVNQTFQAQIIKMFYLPCHLFVGVIWKALFRMPACVPAY